jgi:hypothetical protein
MMYGQPPASIDHGELDAEELGTLELSHCQTRGMLLLHLMQILAGQIEELPLWRNCVQRISGDSSQQ